jgi:hypothetical protein
MRACGKINRRIADQARDTNLNYGTIAGHYLIAEGLQPERFKTTRMRR